LTVFDRSSRLGTTAVEAYKPPDPDISSICLDLPGYGTFILVGITTFWM
jgi:hypothetical protein